MSELSRWADEIRVTRGHRYKMLHQTSWGTRGLHCKQSLLINNLPQCSVSALIETQDSVDRIAQHRAES